MFFLGEGVPFDVHVVDVETPVVSSFNGLLAASWRTTDLVLYMLGDACALTFCVSSTNVTNFLFFALTFGSISVSNFWDSGLNGPSNKFINPSIDAST